MLYSVNIPQSIRSTVDGPLDSFQVLPITKTASMNSVLLLIMEGELFKNLLQIFISFRSHFCPSSGLQKLTLGLLAVASGLVFLAIVHHKYCHQVYCPRA